MCMPMYATPTFITEALHLVTYGQQFKKTVKMNSWLTHC